MAVELTDTITIAEAARRCGVHPNSVRDWAAQGRIETISTPLGKLVISTSLEAFRQRRADKAKETPSRS